MKPTCLSALVAGLALPTTAASADDRVAKPGEFDDLAGLYADGGGRGSVLALNIAVEDSGPLVRN